MTANEPVPGKCGAQPPEAAKSHASIKAKDASELRSSASGVPLTSRRTFVVGCVGVAALVALGGAGRALGEPAGLIRPPGAQSADFLGRCIRCDKCRTACPTHVIGVAKLEQGVLAVRTPVMEFRQGYCDTCDGAWRCIAACPTGAFAAFDPSRDKIALAVIDEAKCETYGVSASCGRVCVDACPAQAISADDAGRVHIDEAACWGCGACEHVCPANAYRTYDGVPGRGVNMVAWEGDSR